MKIINKITIVFSLTLSFFVLQGCDLDVDNLNEPDRDRVLGDPSEAVTLLDNSAISFFSNLLGRSRNYDHLADQFITCSGSSWQVNREPRERLTNDIGGTFERLHERDWKAFYEMIITANDILIRVDTWESESDAYRNSAKASALLLKGLATGYAGVIYKEAIIVEASEIPLTIENIAVSDYNEVINKAIEYLEEAKAIYTNNPDLEWSSLPNIELSSVKVVQLINTYAAKFLLGKARNNDQFKVLDFSKIQSYLDNSIESTVTAIGTTQLYGSHQYSASRIRRNQFSYSADQKIPWLLSGKAVPTKKGVDDSTPITSIDKRAELYFVYKEQTRFRYSERDPSLYSNYGNIRFRQEDSDGKGKDRQEYPANILHVEEIPVLKAEVAYGLGNYALAESLLNSSRRVTVGEMPLLTGADPVKIADALFYENSIELNLMGKGIQWMFMRRWDLLQEGTMLHMPIPAQESQLMNVDIITIGGQGTGDGIDSAKGDNSWR
ncbi:MAG: hypothetical protein V3U92_17665 [Cellulophaga sp.]